MITIKDKVDCCGCEACVQICPKSCIRFESDEEGFQYPLVNTSLCIDCGLCERTCPILNQGDPRKPLECYWGRNTDEAIQIKSSSGGVFSALAKCILDKGGIVYGAAFAKDWSVKHISIENEYDLEKLRGSKYVQSRIGDTYKEVERLVKDGRWVLFSGTGCQVAGLKRYLHKNYDTLLTVEVICHGVPSPLVWHEYLKNPGINKTVAEDNSSNPYGIKQISFRDKKHGWHKFGLRILFLSDVPNEKERTRSYIVPHFKNEYMNCFLRNYILRPSCYDCASKNGKSMADICLGDLWLQEQVLEIENDEKGLSAVLAYTNRGIAMLRETSGLELHPLDYSLILGGNPVLEKSVESPIARKRFWEAFLQSNNKINIINKFGKPCKGPSVISKIKSKILKLYRFILKLSNRGNL